MFPQSSIAVAFEAMWHGDYKTTVEFEYLVVLRVNFSLSLLCSILSSISSDIEGNSTLSRIFFLFFGEEGVRLSSIIEQKKKRTISIY